MQNCTEAYYISYITLSLIFNLFEFRFIITNQEFKFLAKDIWKCEMNNYFYLQEK